MRLVGIGTKGPSSYAVFVPDTDSSFVLVDKDGWPMVEIGYAPENLDHESEAVSIVGKRPESISDVCELEALVTKRSKVKFKVQNLHNMSIHLNVFKTTIVRTKDGKVVKTHREQPVNDINIIQSGRSYTLQSDAMEDREIILEPLGDRTTVGEAEASTESPIQGVYYTFSVHPFLETPGPTQITFASARWKAERFYHVRLEQEWHRAIQQRMHDGSILWNYESMPTTELKTAVRSFIGTRPSMQGIPKGRTRSPRVTPFSLPSQSYGGGMATAFSLGGTRSSSGYRGSRSRSPPSRRGINATVCPSRGSSDMDVDTVHKSIATKTVSGNHFKDQSHTVEGTIVFDGVSPSTTVNISIHPDIRSLSKADKQASLRNDVMQRLQSLMDNTYVEAVYESSDTCVICMDKAPTHFIVPCGHKAFCDDVLCTRNIKMCPICRGPNLAVVSC